MPNEHFISYVLTANVVSFEMESGRNEKSESGIFDK
jgi:hypothetical protein